MPLLVDLLTDSVARTRANAAGESSYHMTFHNDQLDLELGIFSELSGPKKCVRFDSTFISGNML